MLELRPFGRDDFQRLISWITSPEFLLQWAGPSFAYPLDKAQLEKYVQESEGRHLRRRIFKAVDTASDSVVGHIELSGIDLRNKAARVCRVLVGDPSYRGKGIGTWMMKKILDLGFNQYGLHRIDLVVFDFNKPAIRCYEKLGFVKEGCLRECRKIGDEYWSLCQMSILESEWRSSLLHENKEQMGRYSVGYDDRTARFMQERTADTHAQFLIPYLVSGMDLLDGGCGPGTITKGLAEIVAPGRVLGVDKEQSQIFLAQRHTDGSPTFEFKVGDLCSLNVDDESFDVVFVHGVLEHIPHPKKAVSEIHRVLRPGGLVGSRHADFGGFLLEPTPLPLGLFSQLFIQLMRRNGGDPYCGRRQPGLFRDAGFEIVKVSASYDCWTSDMASTQRNAEFLSELCGDSGFSDQLLEYGLTDRGVLNRLSSAFLTWGKMPEAFAAEAWGELVARKT